MKAVRSCWYVGTALSMIMSVAPASAQTAPERTDAETQADSDIIVTGSRIQRSGYDAPTPTIVIGETELRQGNRVNVGAVLNDMPGFRATFNPSTTAGSTSPGLFAADFRGLGSVRTLTLIDGHRFSGSADLNSVPSSLIKRVDVVTGGASAAYGSGAVAGVVNIILDDKLKGLRVGTLAGMSSRGDGARYGADAAFGTQFADGRGHFMIGGEYLDEKGILNRDGRPKIRSGLFQRADGSVIIAQNVKSTQFNTNGSILNGTGVPYRLVFNSNGSISPFPVGSETVGGSTIGGGGQNMFDYVPVYTPYQRANVFARVSYDVTDSLKIWATGSYARVWGDVPLYPQSVNPVIMPDNAFLTADARATLASRNIGAFVLGRYLDDVGPGRTMRLKSARRNLEGAIGFDGTFGNGWKYNGYYDHGETRQDQRLYNQTIAKNFANAVDAVLVNGTAVCRINAVTVTDPNCKPINLFGNGNISNDALGYAFGSSHLIATSVLDAAGASVSGQPFSTWAGAVDVVVGTDWRWEKQIINYIDPLSRANALGLLNSSGNNGGFNVKEFFGEVSVPLLNIPDVVKLDVNGAARYSDYSTSGGIWSWKGGGTARFDNGLLLRGVYSRDIRSPGINEYFLTRSTSQRNVQDPFNSNLLIQNVAIYTGGNVNLQPETSHTLTIGGSYSPRFAPRLNMSVDYYKIKIKNVITTVPAENFIQQCYKQTPGDNTCGGLVVRDNGVLKSITGTYVNLAYYDTAGIDFDVSYRAPVGNGSLTFRGIAIHVMHLRINNFLSVTDVAGVVRAETPFSTPNWRFTAAVTYEDSNFGVDLRSRYVGGGVYSRDAALPIVNNDVSARTYFDLGLQAKAKQFTWFVNVNNLFDVAPPLTPYATQHYDMIGRYITTGVKLKL